MCVWGGGAGKEGDRARILNRNREETGLVISDARSTPTSQEDTVYLFFKLQNGAIDATEHALYGLPALILTAEVELKTVRV